MQALRDDQQGHAAAECGHGPEAHDRDHRGSEQPGVCTPAREPVALGPEEGDLDGHRHGPQGADRALAVAQRVEVQRQEDIQRGVRQHREEDAREEPGHHRLAQDLPDAGAALALRAG